MSDKSITLLISSLTMFFVSFMASALTVAVPVIGMEFRADAIILSWMVSAFVLAMAVFSVPIGRMADIVGIKKAFISGMILYTVASFIAAFSVSSLMLIICRSLQGIAAAVCVCTVLALLTAIYPPDERGRAFGINVAFVYIGTSLGPFLGGLLTEYFGWRSIFYTNIPFSIIMIILLIWKIKGEWSVCKGEKFDFLGSIIYGIALVALMYGFSVLPQILGIVLVVLGIAGLIAFLRVESQISSPILNVNVLRGNTIFISSSLAALINYSAVFAVAFLLSLYLQYIKGLTPDQTGLILLAQPAVQAVLSPFTGRLSDRIEPRKVASTGMALTSIGLLSLVFLSGSTSLIQIIITLMFLGAGIALFASPNSNAIMNSVEPRYYGVASATVSTVRSMGQMLSMGITMIILALVIGRVAITPEYYPGFLTSTKIAFSAFTILCLAGILPSLSRGKMK